MAAKVRWDLLREQLWQRSGGRCEVSGKDLDQQTFDAHHRRNKGMGGTTRPDRDAIWNLLALDPQVHNGGPESVHGRRRWAQKNGFLIPKNVRHLHLWPLKLHEKTWVLLRPDGGYHYLPVRTALGQVSSSVRTGQG